MRDLKPQPLLQNIAGVIVALALFLYSSSALAQLPEGLKISPEDRNNPDLIAHKKALEEARERDKAEDCDGALARYEESYERGLEAVTAGAFGSREMTIPVNIRTGEVMKVNVPKGKEELEPVREEAVKVAARCDHVDATLHWLRLGGIIASFPSEEIAFPEGLELGDRLGWDRRRELDALIEYANLHDAQRVRTKLIFERQRFRRIAEVEHAHWQNVRDEKRTLWAAILLVGYLVIIALTLWFSRAHLEAPRLPFIYRRRARKRYLRYTPSPSLTSRREFVERIYNVLARAYRRLGTFALGLGAHALAGVFVNMLWSRPGNAPFLFASLAWLFAGVGVFLCMSAVSSKSTSRPHDPIDELRSLTSPETFLAGLRTLSRLDRALCRMYRVPVWFVRWRDPSAMIDRLMPRVAHIHSVTRAIVSFYIAERMASAGARVPRQLELWFLDGVATGIVPYCEEVLDDFLAMLPELERLRWREEVALRRARLPDEPGVGVEPDEESIERDLERELEIAMLLGRRWSVDQWVQRFIERSDWEALRHRVVWCALDSRDEIARTFRIEQDLSLVDEESDELALDQNQWASIGVLHPGLLSDAAHLAWSEHMADYELIMGFSQLSRHGAVLEPDQKTLRIERDLASVQESHFHARGWLKPYGQSYFQRVFYLHDVCVRLHADNEIVFYRGRHALEKIDFASLHPVSRSELLYELECILNA